MSSYTKYDQTAIAACEKLNWDSEAIHTAYPDLDNGGTLSPEGQALADHNNEIFNNHWNQLTTAQQREFTELNWGD